MAGTKYKTTGFARFLFMMLLVAPLAYIGASYYNGEDGIENIKQLFGIGQKTEQVTETAESPSASSPSSSDETHLHSQLKKLKDENAYLEKRNNELYLENESLKKELEAAKSSSE